MKTKSLSFLAVFLLLLTAASCNQSRKEGKLFIIGGGDFNSEMRDKMIHESGIDKGGYMVILPMSSEEPDTAFFYTKLDFKVPEKLDIYGFIIKKGDNIPQSRIDSIRNAKMIFISGGDQSRFMDIIAGTQIKQAIHDAFENGSLICGTSAGASLMSKQMVTGNELKHPTEGTANFNSIEAQNVEIIEGLGFLKNIIIDQHFIVRKRLNRLLSMIIEHPDLEGIGIDESTAIFVEGNNATVYGVSQVVVVQHPSAKFTVKNGLLGARKLQLDVYLPGESFKIKNPK
jgi:cyanophycinase